jgi:hypothetical protein
MAEVKAQAVGAHLAPGLTDVRSKDVAKRSVKQMGGGVIAGSIETVRDVYKKSMRL